MFKIAKSVDKWGEKILTNSDFIKGDLFYIFFMMGVSLGKTEEFGNEASVNSGTGHGYAADYIGKRDLLATILMVSESKKSKFEKSDEIRDAMDKYISMESETRLNGSGESIMNMYAHAGFIHLREKIPNPQDPHIFLIEAYEEINRQFKENTDWK
jgi:hypothetical protein